MEELETDESTFTIEESRDAAGDPVLKLSGELDILSADSFRAVVERVIAATPPRLVFDLEALMFMDSSGIAVMVYAANAVSHIELLHAPTIIRRVIETTGLSEILRLDAP
jgi:anti-sigma B factor antagonist